MYMGGGWRAKLTDTEFWGQFIENIPDHVFLSVRQLLKAAALNEFNRRATKQYERCAETKSLTERLTANLTPQNADTLLIGFARRFATYKRATLIFKDLERLARLVNDPDRPITFVFAGKAHPSDKPGQALLKEIYQISLRPEFQGRIILLEDYNLSMARDLLPGVDVWLNTPEYPMEACGTSGMKAAINGVINLSVMDGWWAEAYDGSNGWAITPHPEFDHEIRARLEAEELMNILEYQVIPTYYARNRDGQPEAWIYRSKASMKTILPQFNTIRMAIDYLRDSYAPAAREGRLMQADKAAGARELAHWKHHVAEAWPKIRARLEQPIPDSIQAGQILPIDVAVHLNGLDPDDLFVECILGTDKVSGEALSDCSVPLFLTGINDDGEAVYHCDLFDTGQSCWVGGLQQFQVRIYPCHHLLSHPLECGLMIWL